MFSERNTGAAEVNLGQGELSELLGLPVAAKLVHAATNWSDRVISLPSSSRGCPVTWSRLTPRLPPWYPVNRNWMSMVWAASGWKCPVVEEAFGICGK